MMSTQDEILAVLLEQDGQPISGQSLADQLGLSRTAVWKAVESLRQQGYQIASLSKKGYLLEKVSHTLDAQQIKRDLDAPFESLHVALYDSVTSTNDLAKQFAIQSPGQAGLFIARKQTQGRGRSGRHFHSDIASGLYLSVVFQPQKVRIKWVNDLFCRGRKIAGILTEATTDIESRSLSSIIIGIGLNLSGDFSQAEAATQSVAGTLFGQEMPNDFNPNQVIHDYLKQLAYYIRTLSDKTYLPHYEEHLLGVGRQVSYQQAGQEYTGIIQGITDQGHLLVQDPHGQIRPLFSQEVHFSSQQFADDLD